jgi:hypothetical protein
VQLGAGGGGGSATPTALVLATALNLLNGADAMAHVFYATLLARACVAAGALVRGTTMEQFQIVTL